MKRIYSLLLVCLICMALVVPCYAAEFVNPPIVDGAAYLSESELAELSGELEAIRQKYNLDVAIVTEYEMSGYDVMSTADDIFDYNGYGAGENADGIMLYISASDREYWLTTHADGSIAFNENGIEYLKNNIEPYLAADDYYNAMATFADLSDELLEMAANGQPFDQEQHSAKYYAIVLGCALIIPLLIASVCTSSKASKMKTAVVNDYAADYMKPGSKRIDYARDIFLYSNIIKTKKETSSSGGSHKSSSGRTHGGGGGKF